MALGPALTRVWPRTLATVAFENGVVIGFEAGEGGIEHFPARHDDDVEAGGDFMAPEHLSGETFGAVPFDGRPEFPRGSHTEPRRGSAVRQHEQCHEAAMDPSAFFVDALEFGPAADALGNRQTLPAHGTRDLTVRRRQSAASGLLRGVVQARCGRSWSTF